MTCRICLEDGDLIQPCDCKGTSAYVHEKCLLKWLNVSDRTDCEICKFEYDCVDVEEDKIVYCPTVRLSDSSDHSVVVIVTGVMGFLVFMFFTTYMWGFSTEDVFVYGNLGQFVVALALYNKIRTAESVIFWKCCLSTSLLLLSILENDWSFYIYETTAAFIIGVHTYVRLVLSEKEIVTYINVEDRSVNEIVQGP